MKHLIVSVILLATGLTANAATLYCTPQGQEGPVTLIKEDVPSVGLATVISGQNSSVLKYTNNIEVSTYGCYEKRLTTKTFFHPYYEYKIQNSRVIGMENTRCASTGNSEFQGALVAEMQAPQNVVCTIVY